MNWEEMWRFEEILSIVQTSWIKEWINKLSQPLSSSPAGNNVEVDESLFQEIEDLDLDEDDPDFDPLEMGSDEDWSGSRTDGVLLRTDRTRPAPLWADAPRRSNSCIYFWKTLTTAGERIFINTTYTYTVMSVHFYAWIIKFTRQMTDWLWCCLTCSTSQRPDLTRRGQ